MTYSYIIHVDSCWLLIFFYVLKNDQLTNSFLNVVKLSGPVFLGFFFIPLLKTRRISVQIWIDIFCVFSNTTRNGFVKVFTDFLRCSRCSLSDHELLNLFKAVRCFLKTSFHVFAFNSLLIMMELFLALPQHLNIYNLYVNVHYINGHIQLCLYYKKFNSFLKN